MLTVYVPLIGLTVRWPSPRTPYAAQRMVERSPMSTDSAVKLRMELLRQTVSSKFIEADVGGGSSSACALMATGTIKMSRTQIVISLC